VANIPLPVGSWTVPGLSYWNAQLTDCLPADPLSTNWLSTQTDCLSSSQAGAISHQPPTLLTAISGLFCNGSWSSLYNFSMDPTKNTSANSSSVVAWHSCWHGLHREYYFQQLFCYVCVCCGHSLGKGMFAAPFPSNSCLCWLHISGFQQTCHNIMKGMLLLSNYSNWP
jgi:hypothetical protein